MRQFARSGERATLLLLARPSADAAGDEDEEESVIVETHEHDSGVSEPGERVVIDVPTHDLDRLRLARHESKTTFRQQEPLVGRPLDDSRRVPLSSDSRLPTTLTTTLPSNAKAKTTADHSFETELANLHIEMEHIRSECSRLAGRGVDSKPRAVVSPPSSSSRQSLASRQAAQASSLLQMIERLSQRPLVSLASTTAAVAVPQPPTPRTTRRAARDETSSAYNTGAESGGSSPAKPEQPPIAQSPVATTSRTPRPSRLTVTSRQLLDLGAPQESLYHTIETPLAPTPATPVASGQFRLPRHLAPSTAAAAAAASTSSRRQSTTAHRDVAVPGRLVGNTARTDICAGQTMLTTPAMLDETIKLQQRLMREALGFNTPQTSAAVSLPLSVDCTSAVRRDDAAATYEWKVKRRVDGSRYVTRRPLRAQVLKAREEQVNRERCQISTDDDAASELKTGKFWTRQQRKQHLVRQRERKQRRLDAINTRPAVADSERVIRELYERKQARRHGAQQFDTYTTLQELLIHGVRDPALRLSGGILSVTTV